MNFALVKSLLGFVEDNDITEKCCAKFNCRNYPSAAIGRTLCNNTMENAFIKHLN